MNLGDAQALIAEVKGIARLSPVSSGRAQVKYASRNASTQIHRAGPRRIWPSETWSWRPDGRSPRPRSTAWLTWRSSGPQTAQKLFDDSDPLGMVIKIKGINFRVIGRP